MNYMKKNAEYREFIDNFLVRIKAVKRCPKHESVLLPSSKSPSNDEVFALTISEFKKNYPECKDYRPIRELINNNIKTAELTKGICPECAKMYND